MYRTTKILIAFILFTAANATNASGAIFYSANDSINEALFDESEVSDRQISTYTAETSDSTQENTNSEEFDLPEGLVVNIDSLLNSWHATCSTFSTAMPKSGQTARQATRCMPNACAACLL